MGVSYRPDNPFASDPSTYAPDNPFAVAARPALLSRVGTAVKEMVTHPWETAKGIVTAPLHAAKTGAEFIGQSAAETMLPDDVRGYALADPERISEKDALLAAAQLATIGPGGRLHLMPVYIGMLAAADVVQRGGRPVAVHLDTRLNVSAFAFVRPDHTLRVAVINRTPSTDLFVRFHFPSKMELVRRYCISAPSLQATRGVITTGVRVSGSTAGRMKHNHPLPQRTPNSQDELASPASSIVIAVFHR